MAANYSLFIVHGPPSPAVPCILKQRLPNIHEYTLVHPSRLYEEHPTFGVRDVANHVLSLLKKHEKVVLEDNSARGGVRDCLLKIIPIKLPACKVHVVEVSPRHGQQHTLWERQFFLAASPQSHHILSDDQLLQWFDEDGCCIKSDPSSSVGPKEPVTVELTAASHFKFEVPCLLVQWECLVDSGGFLEDKMKAVCQHWTKANPFGRVVFLCDGQAVAKSKLSAVRQKTQIIRCSKALANELLCPVFVLYVTSTIEAGQFSMAPHPGLLAFLQRRHHINLHHRNTVFVYSDIKHMQMAERAGVKHVKIGKVLKNPEVMRTCHNATISPLPPMLRQIQLVSDSTSADASTPLVPLADCLDKFDDQQVFVDYPRGLREFAFAQNVQIFQRFQSQFAEHATRVGQPGSRLERQQQSTPIQFVETSISGKESTLQEHVSDSASRQIPEWMLGRDRSASDDLATQVSMEKCCSTSSVEDGGRARRTIYIMTEVELVETAKEVLKQAGKEDMIQSLTLRSAKDQNTCLAKETHNVKIPQSSVADDVTEKKSEMAEWLDVGTLKEMDTENPSPHKKQRLSSPTLSEDEEQKREIAADLNMPQDSPVPVAHPSTAKSGASMKSAAARKPPDLSILDDIFS